MTSELKNYTVERQDLSLYIDQQLKAFNHLSQKYSEIHIPAYYKDINACSNTHCHADMHICTRPESLIDHFIWNDNY